MRSFSKFLVPALVLALAGCVDGRQSTQTLEAELEDCAFTQGYWKNHEEAWPVDELMLGDHSYTQDELLEILRTPVQGNGLIALAHQLIAAKLNVADGAPDDEIADAIDAADELIGDLVVGEDSLPTSETSDLVGELDTFNNDGPSSCESEPEPFCGDGTMDDGEACDDGNDLDGDGCDSDCMIEEPPPPPPEPFCGDGTMDDGEACDDGNDVDGDGCTDCMIDVPPPPPPDGECGNGVLEAGEDCDDGNTDETDSCSNDCHFLSA